MQMLPCECPRAYAQMPPCKCLRANAFVTVPPCRAYQLWPNEVWPTCFTMCGQTKFGQFQLCPKTKFVQHHLWPNQVWPSGQILLSRSGLLGPVPTSPILASSYSGQFYFGQFLLCLAKSLFGLVGPLLPKPPMAPPSSGRTLPPDPSSPRRPRSGWGRDPPSPVRRGGPRPKSGIYFSRFGAPPFGCPHPSRTPTLGSPFFRCQLVPCAGKRTHRRNPSIILSAFFFLCSVCFVFFEKKIGPECRLLNFVPFQVFFRPVVCYLTRVPCQREPITRYPMGCHPHSSCNSTAALQHIQQGTGGEGGDPLMLTTFAFGQHQALVALQETLAAH